ncbi:MAG: ABC transporter ATP-binding protein, partial [Pseudomonadota bacterium]
TMAIPMAIEIVELTKKFPGKLAVDHLNLEIPYGQITALLGSNGAGKTTTLNMIVGFLRPDSGIVRIGGKDNFTNLIEAKRKIGYLGTEMALYEKFSVKECWEFFAKLRGLDRVALQERIKKWVDYFEMGDFLDKKFHELSSGQKQKSLIVSSILHDPEILIFDEVTASLDVLTCRLIMNFLKEEKSRGKAVLFSTHILSEVEYLSDQVAILHEGKLRDVTTSANLLQKHNVTNLTDAFYFAVKDYKEAA